MNRLMAPRAPTSAPPQSAGGPMVGPANNNPGRRLLLEVALETKIGVARDQHLVIDRAVRIVTRGASLAHSLVFEDKRPALGGVALAASFVLREQRCAAAADGRTLVGIVTIAATHLAIQHRMAVGQSKLALFVQMTLEASLGRPFGIENRVVGTTTLIVNAAWAVARFAPDVFRIRPLGFETRVGCRLEIAHQVGMTFRATLRACKLGARNLRRDDDSARHGRT